MKILLLADRMENGGAETHIYELSRLLSQKGHFVTVLSFGGNVADILAEQGISQAHYGKFPLLTLWHFIQTQKPDVVHAHTRQSAFLCRLLLSFMQIPVVFTAHAHFSTDPIKRTFSFFPRRTIAVSADIAEHLVHRFGVASNRISVIENGIDTKRFCPKRNTSEDFHIVTVSRLDRDCSLTASLLCRIAPLLAQKIPRLRITIIGGGSELESIRKLASQANAVGGKKLVNAIGQKQDVLPYLQSASLFIGVSRAAMEAMSCGIPVILSGNEGYLGIAVGKILSMAEHGNFCARGYPKPKAKCIFRDILRLFFDNFLASRAKSDTLRQIRLYHTAEQMAEKTMQIYRAAILDSQKNRKSDILLCGYYGYGNLGDELSLRAICSRLYTKDTARSNGARCRALSFDTLRLSVLAPKGSRYEPLNCVNRFSPLAVVNAIRSTGLFMLGGGSLLQNKTSNRSLFYYLTLLEIAHFFGIPTMLYAAGIGPIHGKIPSALCKHALQKTDLITVRDPLSLAFLKNLGITDNVLPSADPVLFFQTPKTRSGGYLLAFVRKEEWKTALAFLEKSSKPICLAVMDKKSDLAATKKLARTLLGQGKRVTVYESLPAQKIFALIGGADLVISARLHALILSFCMGVPFVGISGDPKITALSQTVYKDCPLPWTRKTLTAHFQEKRKEMLTLAKKDALYALRLAKRGSCP